MIGLHQNFGLKADFQVERLQLLVKLVRTRGTTAEFPLRMVSGENSPVEAIVQERIF